MAYFKIFILSTLYLATGTAVVDNGFQNIGILQAIVIILLSATVTALLRKANSFIETLKNWAAGICAGLLMYLWMNTTNVETAKKFLIVIVVSAFISSIYPKAEKLTNKWFDKKIGDGKNNI